MEKENRIPPSRRRPGGSDGPAPTALATQGESASDDPAGGDAGSGQDEEGLAGGRPGAKQGGLGPAEAVPGPRAPQGQRVASSPLPQRVRGMSDGPRPPAQVARPVLPPSFLERVRAAAEAEQRLEQRAQDEARHPTEPEPPAARPAEPRRPPRFVRSRDWMARSGDKKERARGDQAGPGPQRGTAGDQLRPTREGLAGGGNDAAEPGPAAALPRRTAGASPGPRPAAQARPDTPVAPEPRPADASTEPIPVIRVSLTGEPLPPADMGSGIPATDGPPAAVTAQAPSPRPAQATTAQAPAGQAQAAPAPAEQTRTEQTRTEQTRTEQARTEQARTEQARTEQAPAEKAPARHAAATKRAAAGHSAAAKRAAAGQADAQRPSRQQAAAQQAAGRQANGRHPAAQQAAAQEPAEQATDREAAARQAQQAAARRAADEAAVQRAAKLLARKSSPGRNRRLVGLAAALLLVIGGVTAGFAFAGHSSHHDHLASPDSVATIVVNRDHAAAWIARQVSPTAMVSCDPVTCVVIESHGFPASHVQALGTGATPLSSNLVVATPAVRDQFGARLASVLAPGLLATFGSGRKQVSIRVVAPQGPAAYRTALQADLQNRRMSGAGLSGSNRIQAPNAAQKQLVAGQVDSRLMITLALMASLHPVDLLAFGDGGPDLAAAPFRSAELLLTGSAQKRLVLGFLSQQRPPYAPAHVTTRKAGPDRTILDMRFAAPSPVGLFH
jgi:hypothetical protein